MYQLLVLFVVLNVVNSHCHGDCPWRHRGPPPFHIHHGPPFHDLHGLGHPPHGHFPGHPHFPPFPNFPPFPHFPPHSPPTPPESVPPPGVCPTPEFVPGKTFEDIAKNLILIDKAVKELCSGNNRQISEVYGSDNYILKYQMPEFEESDINVKVMNRIIYTTATNGQASFKDIRILPDILKIGDARWVLEHKTLKVFIPYKTPMMTEVLKTCEDVDESTINVPLMKGTPLGLRMMPDNNAE